MDGEPIDEPVVGHGPFVMNTRSEIEKAFAEFRAGEMGEIG
jgi:redox-sensitive bicupin YhaK (pirin superfamily)